MEQAKEASQRPDFTKPESLCVCGHTGDGQSSEHKDTFSFGHGPCTKCSCPQFTWKRWLENGK